MTQHTTPCKDCPWSRAVKPGALGGSLPDKYIGQAAGPFWLPCHCHSNFSDPKWKEDLSKAQCAGAAIYRANLEILPEQRRAYTVPRPEALLRLPANTKLVFASPAEFLMHHATPVVKLPLSEWEKWLTYDQQKAFALKELYSADAKIHLIERK